jgi:hypothetical protein
LKWADLYSKYYITLYLFCQRTINNTIYLQYHLLCSQQYLKIRKKLDLFLITSYNNSMPERKYRLTYDHLRTVQRNKTGQVGITGAALVEVIYRNNEQVKNWATASAEHHGGVLQAVAQAADSKTAVATIAGLGTLTVLNGLDAAHQAHKSLDARQQTLESVIPVQESPRRGILKSAGKVAATATVMYMANKAAAHNPEMSDIIAVGATGLGLAYLQAAKNNLRERIKNPLSVRRITKIKNLARRR